MEPESLFAALTGHTLEGCAWQEADSGWGQGAPFLSGVKGLWLLEGWLGQGWGFS